MAKRAKEKENVKNKKNSKLLYVILISIIIILIIIIILLLRNYKNALNNKLTGNIEIFEVDCNCNNVVDSNGLAVSDETQIWTSENTINIFKNPVYEMDEIIAPGTSNSYNFVIKNKSDCEMIYKLQFEEDNQYNVNMKYRLKKNGEFVTEEWKKINDIDINEYSLESGAEDDYLLEWKWFDSPNDTEVGSIDNSTYSLKVEIVGKKNIN